MAFRRARSSSGNASADQAREALATAFQSADIDRSGKIGLFHSQRVSPGAHGAVGVACGCVCNGRQAEGPMDVCVCCVCSVHYLHSNTKRTQRICMSHASHSPSVFVAVPVLSVSLSLPLFVDRFLLSISLCSPIFFVLSLSPSPCTLSSSRTPLCFLPPPRHPLVRSLRQRGVGIRHQAPAQRAAPGPHSRYGRMHAYIHGNECVHVYTYT